MLRRGVSKVHKRDVVYASSRASCLRKSDSDGCLQERADLSSKRWFDQIRRGMVQRRGEWIGLKVGALSLNCPHKLWSTSDNNDSRNAT